jgi:hypothetical protein
MVRSLPLHPIKFVYKTRSSSQSSTSRHLKTQSQSQPRQSPPKQLKQTWIALNEDDFKEQVVVATQCIDLLRAWLLQEHSTIIRNDDDDEDDNVRMRTCDFSAFETKVAENHQPITSSPHYVVGLVLFHHLEEITTHIWRTMSLNPRYFLRDTNLQLITTSILTYQRELANECHQLGLPVAY